MSSIPREALNTRASKPGVNRGFKFDAQRFGARDHFLRIGDVGRRDLVHHLGGRVAQHPLGADVEDLNDTLRVGRDAREVGAVENRVLQGAGFQQRLFRLLARGVVGADQQITDDGVLRVAQRRDRHHRREAAAVLAEVSQLVDVFDAARGLEHQGLEAGRNRGAEFDAERFGARDHFLRIGNVGRRDLVHHLGGGVAQHPLGADVEDLDDALRVGGDAREVGAVENRVLQRAGFRADASSRRTSVTISTPTGSPWENKFCFLFLPLFFIRPKGSQAAFQSVASGSRLAPSPRLLSVGELTA